jgi:SSS family solute:Na+ symporter
MFLGFGIILFSSCTQYGGINFLIQNTPDYAFAIPGNFNWSFIFVWGLIALITFIDPSFYQRTFSGNSLKSVQKGILISIVCWMIFDFMSIFTGLYALAILPSVETTPYLDLAELVLSPLSKGIFFVSLFAIVASTIDSFTFISAYTLGRDLPAILNKYNSDDTVLRGTRWGLLITAIISIILAFYFDHAVDIWYLTGSFVVPVLLIPLLCALYGVRIKHTAILLLFPLLASVGWHLYGIMNPLAGGYPGYIGGFDPMYPGVVLSAVLFYFFKI